MRYHITLYNWYYAVQPSLILGSLWQVIGSTVNKKNRTRRYKWNIKIKPIDLFGWTFLQLASISHEFHCRPIQCKKLLAGILWLIHYCIYGNSHSFKKWWLYLSFRWMKCKDCVLKKLWFLELFTPQSINDRQTLALNFKS